MVDDDLDPARLDHFKELVRRILKEFPCGNVGGQGLPGKKQ